MTDKIASIAKHQRVALYSVRPEISAFDALVWMDAHGIALVLVAEDGRLHGVFSAKDYFTRLVLNGRNGKEAPVREVMTKAVLAVRSSATAGECLQIMTTNGFRHLPVVDDGRLVGLVTRADVMKHQLADKQSEIDELLHYIGS